MEEKEANLRRKLKKVSSRTAKRKIEGALFGFQVVLCHNDLLSGNILLFNNVTNAQSSSGPGSVIGSKATTQYSLEEKNNGSWSPESWQLSSNEDNDVKEIHISHADDSSVSIDEEVEDTEGITLIDFEYAGYNCRAWDLANHFNEFAGFDFNIEKDFPTREQRLKFLKNYVKGVARNASGSGSNSISGSGPGSSSGSGPGSISGSGPKSSPGSSSGDSSGLRADDTLRLLEDVLKTPEDFNDFVDGFEVRKLIN